MKGAEKSLALSPLQWIQFHCQPNEGFSMGLARSLIASDCSSLFSPVQYPVSVQPVTDPHIRIRWFSIRVIFFCCSSSAAPANVSEIQMELTFRLTELHPAGFTSADSSRVRLSWVTRKAAKRLRKQVWMLNGTPDDTLYSLLLLKILKLSKL